MLDYLEGGSQQVFHQFHDYGTFEKSINATFIALIPKKPGAMEMKNFRPISLIYSEKTIQKGWPRFAAYVSFKVGNGALLSFWQDPWCGDTPLMVRFPELYRIVSHPKASIQDLMIFDGTNHLWDVNFI